MKQLRTLACLMLLFCTSCKKIVTDNASTQPVAADADVSQVTSLKPILTGLVVRDYYYVLNDSAFYLTATDTPRLSIMNGIVVRAFWKDLQTAYNGPITTNNVIDSALQFVAAHPSLNIKLKIRIYAGVSSPSWVKASDTYGGGSKLIPISTVDDNNNPVVDTYPRYWENGYIDAYAKFINKLAIKYDNNADIQEVTGVVGDITTAEPFLLKIGGTPTLNYNPSNTTWKYADTLYRSGLTTPLHTYAIRKGIDIMKACWDYTPISLCFSPLQELTWTNPPSANHNYQVSENLDSTKNIIDYFVAQNGKHGILGNNGLRDTLTSSNADDWKKNGIIYNMYVYMKGKLFGGPLNNQRKCYLYFQTAQPSLIGDFTNTLNSGLFYNADMIEVPSFKGSIMQNWLGTEATVSQLYYFDAQLDAKL